MIDNGQKGMTRPYAVRIRHKSVRSDNWQKWRTHGTYTTQERADKAAEKERNGWQRLGYTVEVYVRKAGLYGDAEDHAASTAQS
jgi:hypothetical protein